MVDLASVLCELQDLRTELASNLAQTKMLRDELADVAEALMPVVTACSDTPAADRKRITTPRLHKLKLSQAAHARVARAAKASGYAREEWVAKFGERQQALPKAQRRKKAA